MRICVWGRILRLWVRGGLPKGRLAFRYPLHRRLCVCQPQQRQRLSEWNLIQNLKAIHIMCPNRACCSSRTYEDKIWSNFCIVFPLFVCCVCFTFLFSCFSKTFLVETQSATLSEIISRNFSHKKTKNKSNRKRQQQQEEQQQFREEQSFFYSEHQHNLKWNWPEISKSE